MLAESIVIDESLARDLFFSSSFLSVFALDEFQSSAKSFLPDSHDATSRIIGGNKREI